MADRSVVYRLTADVSQFRAQMASAAASTKDAASKMTDSTREGEKFRRGLDSVGQTAGKVGLVAAAGLGASVKAAIDWETAWAGVTKTVDGSATQMAALEGQLREMARTMPATHQEIAAVAEAAGQLGAQRESIASFTETMIQLGETTNLSADEAATSIAQMANVMQTAPGEIDNLGAALVALGNDGASTERDIIQMAQRISASGSQIGLAESDILAISNAAASMGVEVEAGGTAISRVFTDLAKATASGGPKLEKFAEIAGVSSSEFQRLFAETPADAFAAFTQGLDRINKSGGDVFSTLSEVGLSDVRVSQALLGMAASGDLLTDSLKLGRSAWQDNTALSQEYAKRLDTTAAQVQVSWNNIKDAGIDVGTSLLPVVEGVAKSAAAIANAFQSLPGPIKSATGPLLGLTAAAGGGVFAFSKIVTGVADARTAMDNLGISSGKTGTALGRLGRLAGGATVALGGLAIIDAIQVGFNDAAPGVEAMTKSLLGLNAAKSLPKDLDGIAESIDRLANPNNAQALQDNLSAALGGIGGGSELRDAKGQIEALDAALSALVSSAGPDVAAAKLDELTASAGLSRGEIGDLKDLLPQYGEALTGAENETKLAADSQGALAEASTDAAGALDANAAAAQKNAEAQAAIRSGAADTAASFLDISAGANDANVSLGQWIKNMADQAAALRDFTSNAEAAANRGLRDGVIKQLRELGPEGALRLAQLGDASKSSAADIAALNAAFGSQSGARREYADSVQGITAKLRAFPKEVVTDFRQNGVPKSAAAITDLTKKYNLTPKQVRTLIKESGAKLTERQIDSVIKTAQELARQRPNVVINAQDNASQKIRAVREMLRGVNGNVATTYINTITRSFGGKNVATARADGGQVYAGSGMDRGARADSIPAMLSHREYVHPVAAVDFYGERFMEDIRARRFPRPTGYADGGLVGVQHFAGGGQAQRMSWVGPNGERAARGLKGLEQALAASTKALEKEKKSRDNLVSARSALSSSVRSAFTSDPFELGNVWASGAGDPRGMLRQQIAQIAQQRKTLASLRKAGLDGQALASVVDDPRKAATVLAMGKSGIREYESLFNQQSKAAASLGSYAAGSVYNAAIRQDDRQIRGLRQDVRGLRSDVQKAQAAAAKARKNAPKRTGREVAKGVNSAASKARRKKR